jgi:hypothetical protein
LMTKNVSGREGATNAGPSFDVDAAKRVNHEYFDQP